MFAWEKQISGQVLRRIRLKRAAEAARTEAPAAGPVRLREVDFADCLAVSALKSRHKLSLDSPANWQRLWKDNPAIDLAGRIPMGWVLEGREGIVGYLGNVPLRCFYRGTALKTATTHGLVVQPGYRLFAGQLVAAYFRQPRVDLLVSTSTNESAGALFRAFKGRQLPQEDYATVLYWVIDPHGFLTGVRKKLDLHGSLATMGTLVGSWILHAEGALRRRHPVKGVRKFKIRELSPASIGDEFDAFWQRELAASGRLMTDRSADALRWHFDVPGDRRKPMVLRCDLDGRMAGYAIVLTNTGADGLRRASIADMLVEDENSLAPQELLIAAFEYARRTKHHVLELLGFPRTIRKVCEEWHPYARKFPSSPYLFKATQPDVQQSLESEDAWYAAPYDGDATLIPQLEREAADRSTGISTRESRMKPRADAFATLYFFHPLKRLLPRRGLPILMYHSVSDREERAHPYYRTVTSPAVFAQQMQYLYDNGYSTLSLSQAVSRMEGPRRVDDRPVVITFDDGFQDFHVNAFPILSKYGFTATMFLPTAYIGATTRSFKGMECLTWGQVRRLRDAGMEFGSHTVTHPQLKSLDAAQIAYEVSASKATIEQELGCAVQSFAYPYAFPETDRPFAAKLRGLIEEAGYENGVSTIIGTADRAGDKLFMKRLPMNSCDSAPLFRAKLEGAYDWLHTFQYVSKLVSG